MPFVGRTREMGQLRAAFDRPDASYVHVSGLRGVGKTALLERVLADYPALHYRCAPLADEGQRATLHARLTSRVDISKGGTVDGVGAGRGAGGGAPVSAGAAEGGTLDWHGLFAFATSIAARSDRGFVLVLDDAFRLNQGRSRMSAALTRCVTRAREEHVPLHVVTVSHGAPPLPAADFAALDPDVVTVRPLSFRAALPLLPGTTPRDRVRAYGAFGGIPRVLDAIEPSLTTSTNIRNLLLDSGAPLSVAGFDWLERDVQNPTRYFAVLTALSHGESDWATVHAGVPDLTTSGQVAPYLQRLEELGLVEARRSLDARPRSRSRRYRITDPFLSFWFRFVHPRLYDRSPDATTYLNDVIRPRRDEHLSHVFTDICRQFMAYDAFEVFGSNAREAGSLWGPNYRVDSAGVLASGPAYYGNCYWDEVDVSATPLTALDRAVGETRYGFGREHRLRLIFAARALPRVVEREVAQRHDASVIGLETMVGDDER